MAPTLLIFKPSLNTIVATILIIVTTTVQTAMSDLQRDLLNNQFIIHINRTTFLYGVI
jgi:hypothetical protein